MNLSTMLIINSNKWDQNHDTNIVSWLNGNKINKHLWSTPIFKCILHSPWLMIIKRKIRAIYSSKVTVKSESWSRLSILFCFVWNCRNIPYQFKKRNKTEQFSSHFKSRPVPDFSAKFRPEHSGFIPHVPFRSWKAIESNWILFNLIN
jgi:hypothetical protein